MPMLRVPWAITATQDGVTSAPVHLTVVPAMTTIDTCGGLNSTENSNGVCLRYAGRSENDQWLSSDPSLALADALGFTSEYKGINQRVYTDSSTEIDTLTEGTYVRFFGYVCRWWRQPAGKTGARHCGK